MKVITLWQPWANLIIDGMKRIETRSWATSYRGPIGIHSAKRPPLDGLLKDLDEKSRQFVIETYGEVLNCKDKFPTGVILGHTELIECIRITEAYSAYVKKYMPKEYAFGDYTPGRWAWVMGDNPIKFSDPIPAKGMQRLWNYDL